MTHLKPGSLSMLVHELRTPLAILQTSFDLLRSLKLDESDRLELFDQIQVAIEHMARLMEDVLLIEHDMRGQFNPRPSYFNLESLCQQIIKSTELLTGRSIVLSIIPANSCPVYLDVKLTRHILSNLLSNAVKYSPSQTPVWLTISCQANQVIIQVQDQGVGIPLESQPFLFDLFYRASNVEKISGTGIGLAIVKYCVESQGGRITVESQLTKGSTFTVTLPLNGNINW
jgi:signal transduction histidine kinase